MKLRIIIGLVAFCLATVALVRGYADAPTKAVGGVRALGAQPYDYEPIYVDVPHPTTEAAAVSIVRPLAEGGGFAFRSVKCERRMGADYCSTCWDHPKHYLGAMLVRCNGDKCVMNLDGGELERIGYNPEVACGRQFE